MKVALVCTILLVFGCRQKQEDSLTEWKAAVRKQSERRVAGIIKQLQQDCDSETLQLAISKVDSIRKARVNRLESTSPPSKRQRNKPKL